MADDHQIDAARSPEIEGYARASQQPYTKGISLTFSPETSDIVAVVLDVDVDEFGRGKCECAW